MYKVLLADDEPYILEGLARNIAWEDYSLELAAQALGGEEAWRVLEAGGIDVLITDIRMPGLDGVALLRRIREKGLDVKCVVLSGYSDFEYVKESARLGIENYLLKPVNLEECYATLEGIVEKLDHERRSRAMLAEGIQVLRDNIILRWMTGSISGEELGERGELLGLDLDGGFRAAVLTCNGEGAEAFAARCKACLEERRLGYAVGQPYGRVLLLLRGEDGAASRRAALEAFGTLEREARLSGLEARMLLGDHQPDYLDACASMRRAHDMRDYLFLHPDRAVADYEEFRRENAELPQHMWDLLQQLGRLEAGRDRESILQILDRLAGSMSGSLVRLDQLYSICMLVVMRVLQGASSQTAALPQLERLRERLGEIYSLTGYEEAMGWVRDRVGDIMDVSEGIRGNYSEPVSRILACVEGDPAREMNLKTIAGELGMNPLYLGQLFHGETGEHFTEFLNRKRMERAGQLLRQGLSVKEAAARAGYLNQNYFYTVFKKHTGKSPNEYRAEGR